MWIVLLVVLVVIVVLVAWAVVSYNGLIRFKNRIEAAWAQIDVQLKRRHDLIPNLVETVKGYASHERETLEAVINARNRAISSSGPAELAANENMVTQALGRVFALSEAYPDLKANQGFQQLQEELTATEDKVAYARQFYNDSVFKYNAKIQQFPTVIFANMAGFKQREYFEADDQSRGPVQVKF
jgi:LemA protein